MSELFTTHSDPTHPAFQPYPHLSLLHPVQLMIEAEQAAEYAIANTAFGVISHLPLPKPHPPGTTLLEKLHVGTVVKLGMAANALNSETNGDMQRVALREPGGLLIGAGIYVAALAMTGATEFASHQIYAHASLGLTRPDAHHGAIASPDE